MKVKTPRWIFIYYAVGYVIIGVVMWLMLGYEQPTSEKTQTSEPRTVTSTSKSTVLPSEEKTIEIQIVANKRMPSVTLAPGVILKNIRCDGSSFKFTIVNRRAKSIGSSSSFVFSDLDIEGYPPPNRIKIKYFDFDGDPVHGDGKMKVQIEAETAKDAINSLKRRCSQISKARITHTVR